MTVQQLGQGGRKKHAFCCREGGGAEETSMIGQRPRDTELHKCQWYQLTVGSEGLLMEL